MRQVKPFSFIDVVLFDNVIKLILEHILYFVYWVYAYIICRSSRVSKLLNINCISAVNVNNSKNMCDLTYFKNGYVNTFSYGYISKMTSGECHNCVKNYSQLYKFTLWIPQTSSFFKFFPRRPWISETKLLWTIVFRHFIKSSDVERENSS